MLIAINDSPAILQFLFLGTFLTLSELHLQGFNVNSWHLLTGTTFLSTVKTLYIGDGIPSTDVPGIFMTFDRLQSLDLTQTGGEEVAARTR
ncbi:hypothetical protein B0H17DRAFT_1190212 [Mycena rosella]|uniref:Uncharacterized protein n=1 Tax=Mycena rosella TaxID=1033263 RepID=A0AAD7MCU7_MYCRO|nr:hypothetical protein B0H17DRAFT_1190212 [Mycena rosella]